MQGDPFHTWLKMEHRDTDTLYAYSYKPSHNNVTPHSKYMEWKSIVPLPLSNPYVGGDTIHW